MNDWKLVGVLVAVVVALAICWFFLYRDMESVKRRLSALEHKETKVSECIAPPSTPAQTVAKVHVESVPALSIAPPTASLDPELKTPAKFDPESECDPECDPESDGDPDEDPECDSECDPDGDSASDHEILDPETLSDHELETIKEHDSHQESENSEPELSLPESLSAHEHKCTWILQHGLRRGNACMRPTPTHGSFCTMHQKVKEKH